MNRFSLSIAVLLIGTARFYGWEAWEPALRGSASKMLGALAGLGLIWLLYACRPSSLLLPVVLWFSWEELQTALCSAIYMIDPWVVPVGQSICSARIDFDLGALGILVVGLLVLWLSSSKDAPR
jgi:hypothetical protein